MVQNVTSVRSPVDIQCSAGTRCPQRATGDVPEMKEAAN
jgi:hypothetical protein